MAADELKVRQAMALLQTAVPRREPQGKVAVFSRLLRARRKEAGLTLQQLADAIGFTKSYVWDVEQGNSNPSTVFVWRVAQLLSIDPVEALESAAVSHERAEA